MFIYEKLVEIDGGGLYVKKFLATGPAPTDNDPEIIDGQVNSDGQLISKQAYTTDQNLEPAPSGGAVTLPDAEGVDF